MIILMRKRNDHLINIKRMQGGNGVFYLLLYNMKNVFSHFWDKSGNSAESCEAAREASDEKYCVCMVSHSTDASKGDTVLLNYITA